MKTYSPLFQEFGDEQEVGVLNIFLDRLNWSTPPSHYLKRLFNIYYNYPPLHELVKRFWIGLRRRLVTLSSEVIKQKVLFDQPRLKKIVKLVVWKRKRTFAGIWFIVIANTEVGHSLSGTKGISNKLHNIHMFHHRPQSQYSSFRKKVPVLNDWRELC